MATVEVKMATHPHRMATVQANMATHPHRMATVQANLATTLTKMATHLQIFKSHPHKSSPKMHRKGQMEQISL